MPEPKAAIAAVTRPVHPHSPLEERLHALSHGAGLIAVLAATPLLAARIDTPAERAAAGAYWLGLVALFAASTAYHAFAFRPVAGVLNLCDQVAIHLLIAGSYTPFCVLAFPPAWGWPLLALVWTLALVGIVVRVWIVPPDRSVPAWTFGVMGWSALLALKPMIDAFPPTCLTLVLSAGGCYTLGLYFHATSDRFGHHLVWHLLVLLATALVFAAVVGWVL